MNPFRSIVAALGLVGLLGLPASGRPASSEFMEYDITWVGISVGTMTIQCRTNGAGNLVRTLRMWNRPWIALVYPVDTTIECEHEETPEGPQYTIHKQVLEKEFRQDDTLVLLPDSGIAIWSNAVNNAVQTSAVPKGSRDIVSFFFDLRDVLANGPLQAGGDYQLVMDGAVHDLEIQTGKPRSLRTPLGRQEAIRVEAISKSSTLFSRNRPKSVWVALSKPAVLFADVESRFGTIRSTLVKWEIDGKPVE